MECLWAVDQMRRTFEDIIFGFELVCKFQKMWTSRLMGLGGISVSA